MAGFSSSSPAADALALSGYVKLMRAAESVTARVHVVLPRDLTITQFAVLEALLHAGPLCHGEIATKVLKSSGNLTLVIKNLEKSGWIKRHRDLGDRRIFTVQLTPAGHRMIQDLFPKIAAAIKREFGILSEAEQVTLARLCKKLGLGRSLSPSR